MRQRLAVVALLGACAHTSTTAPSTTAPSTTPGSTTNAPARDADTYRYVINFVPFGAGQFQNGDTGKGIGFAVAEGVTAVTSFGIWLYLTDRYGTQSIPVEEAIRVRRMQQLEIASGVAFFGLYAWGVVDALVHYPRVQVGSTSIVVVPTPQPSGVGVALSVR